jgi:uncharacterized delta-60 repeat protein
MAIGGDFTTYRGITQNRLVLLNSDGTKDTAFNIEDGFDSGVYSIVPLPGGKFLIAGAFTTYRGVSANGIIRLNSDGTRDTTFDMGAGFNGAVYLIALQPDGKCVVVGGFTQYRSLDSKAIVRINPDGTKDTSFNTGTFPTEGFSNAFVEYISIRPDGKFLVGGDFTSYSGSNAARIIRLNSDGTRDMTFDMGTGFNGLVSMMAVQSDGKILVGGAFQTYQGDSANRIIRLNSDGTRDTTFDMGTGFDGYTIKAINVQSNGKIWVGGFFQNYQGVPASRIIVLNSDGSRDTAFDMGTGFNFPVYSNGAIRPDDKLIIGGYFTEYNGSAADTANRIILLDPN